MPALLGANPSHDIGDWGYIGVVPLLTGLVGTCPLYTLLGLSTCPRDGRSDATRT
ncbi:YgaP family membrane protein [Variovorax arabinosiphilus]